MLPVRCTHQVEIKPRALSSLFRFERHQSAQFVGNSSALNYSKALIPSRRNRHPLSDKDLNKERQINNRTSTSLFSLLLLVAAAGETLPRVCVSVLTFCSCLRLPPTKCRRHRLSHAVQLVCRCFYKSSFVTKSD